MEFENGRKYQKLTKTDKYPWCKKEKTVNKKCKVVKTVSALSLNWANMIFSICIYNVIKFFSKKFKKNCIKTIDIRE